jgi:hypothetical protein
MVIIAPHKKHLQDLFCAAHNFLRPGCFSWRFPVSTGAAAAKWINTE